METVVPCDGDSGEHLQVHGQDVEMAHQITEDPSLHDEPTTNSTVNVEGELEVDPDLHDTDIQANSPGFDSEPEVASVEYHPHLTGPSRYF